MAKKEIVTYSQQTFENIKLALGFGSQREPQNEEVNNRVNEKVNENQRKILESTRK